MNKMQPKFPQPEAERPPFKLTELSEFLRAELPQRELLLDPWLPKQGIAMVYAWRGVGKTHFSLYVAYTVATGGSFLGWECRNPVGVLYIDGEMPGTVLQERLANIVAASGRTPVRPFRIYTPDMQAKDRAGINLAWEDDQQALEPLLDDIELIVVDNIATTCRSGRENDTDAWSPVQGWALRQRAAGRTILFNHHAGNSGRQRGASAREDVLDTSIQLKHPSDWEPIQGARFELTFKKSRGFHGKDAEGKEVQLITDEHGLQKWTVKALEDGIYERVVEMFNDGLSQKEIALEIDRDKSRVSRMLKRAKEEGRIIERRTQN